MDEAAGFEKRRARNLVWSAAGTQEFEPPLLVYNHLGEADLYWNSITGAVYRHFDWPQLQSFYQSLAEDKNRNVEENLFWMALEHAAYNAEVEDRPVFASLRRDYVLYTLSDMNLEKAAINHDDSMSYRLLLGHVQRISADMNAYSAADGKPARHLGERELGLLDAVESTAGLDTAQIIRTMRDAFDRYLPGKARRSFFAPHAGIFGPVEQTGYSSGSGLRLLRKRYNAMRAMSFGMAEHIFEQTEEERESNGLTPRSKAQQADFRKYISNYFGKSLYSDRELRQLERSLCAGADTGCTLYYTRAEYAEKMETGAFVATHNRSGEKSYNPNRSAYEEHRQQYEIAINRLSSRLRNSLLVHLEKQELNSRTGRLNVRRLWRGTVLDEKQIFTRELPSDPGNITVDLMLDASNSQAPRQASVAAQAYVLAESLTRCNIPVRISSFCSVNGCTVMSIYRDYDEPQNNSRVFRYFTAGCNRDGLGIKMLSDMMKNNPAEHRLLITISDCDPYDMAKLRDQSGSFIPYTGEDAVNTTAAAVRNAKANGISVMCIFTGEDRCLPSARRIYDRHFVRIRDRSMIADTVGNLLQSVIRSCDAGGA